MTAPRVSILLPTLNGARDLERLLPVLAAQEVEGGCELRAVDSSSDDDTVARLEAAGAAVEVIPRGSFRHGATRNRLAAGARGEFLLFLSQDAVPEGTGFVATLLDAFDDPRVAGASCRVLPRADDDPLTARTVLDAPEASDVPAVRGLDDSRGYDELDGAARARLVRFNNVASCVRTSVHRRLPFPDVPFGEDAAWAARALTAGWRVAYVAGAVVRHAHRYAPRAAYERYRVDAAFHREVHGHRVRPSLLSALKGLAYELREDARYVRRTGASWRHLLRAPALRGAQVLGQWRGSKGARAGDGWHAPGGVPRADGEPRDTLPGGPGWGAPRAS